MPDFKAKMHQILIRFPMRLRPRPRRGTHSDLTDPLAVFKELASKGMEEKREGLREVNGKERRVKG